MTHSTNLTHWPESMSTISAMSGDASANEAQKRLSILLARIEESLLSSQRALLQRDLGSFEQQTSVQAELCKLLSDHLRDRHLGISEIPADFSQVLHLGRVHLGLLRRAQRSARMLSHLLAKPELGYASAAANALVTRKQVISHQEG